MISIITQWEQIIMLSFTHCKVTTATHGSQSGRNNENTRSIYFMYMVFKIPSKLAVIWYFISMMMITTWVGNSQCYTLSCTCTAILEMYSVKWGALWLVIYKILYENEVISQLGIFSAQKWKIDKLWYCYTKSSVPLPYAVLISP